MSTSPKIMVSPPGLSPGGINSAAVSVAQPWLRMLSSVWGMCAPKRIRLEDDLAKEPKRLAALCKPICKQMLEDLKYPGVPRVKRESVEALLKYMHKRAVEIGWPLDTPLSQKGFRLGFSLAAMCHPRHPIEVQGYVGLFTWLVVQYDDIVGQNEGGMDEAQHFQRRFLNGETQPNAMLEGLAGLLRQAPDIFDPVMASLLQISALKFMTCNLLERHDGFQNMKTTRGAGIKFPDFLRDLAGINVAYAVFCFPKAQYPDVSQYLEAIPDMARVIDISNDVFSFYKEELGGETRNYIHNRRMATGKDVFAVLEDVATDTVDAANRASAILKGRGTYEQSMQECARGFHAMHTSNPRYKMADMDLAEEHPLAPYEHLMAEIFGGHEKVKA
ncbi:longiborneol synthase [Colletotrichum paranaense]|uniref:Longiborneol synthase n=2 Tax=Colletotrichum acutatum species complex TaxID=2707335 RepID=A0AAI9YZ84_9PEZI|nr:longiborneol synthase [Colletotrichum costaricense]XP_060356191.1 longiborneol synthase [Colletotrichum paranaense]KAK1529217.1 longiborneol synthase [Colletotrichum costaricense]KAK1547077.1 longiborneol synthase [Colletotrichum paranaense]